MRKNWNPMLWAGFALVVVGIFSYPLFFARFAITRDFPWVNLILIALGALSLAAGVARAFRQPDKFRGKISGSILATLAVLIVGFFLEGIFLGSRQIPASHGAPKVGEIAPDFTLPDSQGNPVTLTSVLNSGGTAGAVLIFYRGYW